MSTDSFSAFGQRLPAAAITILGSGRLGPTASAVLGLVGVVVGALALNRSRHSSFAGSGSTTAIDRWGPTAAVAFGTIGLIFGGLFLATADGGPGTGNGVVGSVAALAFGPVAIVLGVRARGSGSTSEIPGQRGR